MSAINSMRVKNLRSLEDTEELPIKRLNLLVGRNSGGKSTYARILPLLRQSTEVRKRSPVLWYGRLVDFGSFKDSVRNSDLKKEIELSFRISLDKVSAIQNPLARIKGSEGAYDVLAAITLANASNRTETTVSKLEITFEGTYCRLSFLNGNLQTIEVEDSIEHVNPGILQEITYTGLLPNISTYKYTNVNIGKQEIRVPMKTDIFIGPLAREISNLGKTNLAQETLDSIIDKFAFGNDEEILVQLKSQTEGPKSWINLCRSLEKRSPGFTRLRNTILMARLPQLIEAVDNSLSVLAKNVSYLEPLRATAQRYYRRQELAVDELDSRGENVPFFLDNLQSYEKELLDKWLNKHFGISVQTESSGGHIAIRLKIANAENAVNLADTGFGYSQVLPIALQLWSLTQGRVFTRSTPDATNQNIVVIEQPELHLHPALQSKLADIFGACISDSDDIYTRSPSDLRIIVETHSPSLINRIGEMVALGQISPDHVQVILFEKDDESSITKTRVATYRDDGRLNNWPYGFFDAIDENDDYSDDDFDAYGVSEDE